MLCTHVQPTWMGEDSGEGGVEVEIVGVGWGGVEIVGVSGVGSKDSWGGVSEWGWVK